MWISVLPLFAAGAVVAIASVAFHTSFEVVIWGGLLIVGVAPSIALINLAETELARGTSGHRFTFRSLVLACSFIGCILVAVACAFNIGSMPALWILCQMVGTAPAAVVAAILTARAHQLPSETSPDLPA